MPSWVVPGLLTALLAALVAIPGKVGVRDFDPTAATAACAVVTAAVLGVVTLVLGKAPGRRNRRCRAALSRPARPEPYDVPIRRA